MAGNEARIVLTATDTTGPAFSKVKIGLQSISEQLAIAKQRFAHLAEGFIVLKEVVEPALDAFRELSRSALENADQLVKVSQRTGIAVETLSQLSVAARLADANLGDVAEAAKHFGGLMFEAATGSKEAQALLKAVGVDLKDDLGTALSKVGDLIERLPAGWQKNALSIALFKKSGDQMIPFFNSLREGTKRAKELNLTIGKETGEAAEKFNDNLTLLRIQLEKLVLDMGDKNRPAINAFLEALQEGLARGGLAGAIQAALGEFAKLGGILGVLAGLLRDHGRAVLNLAGIYAGLKITSAVREFVVAQVQSVAAIRQTIVAAVNEATARTATTAATFAQADATRIYTAALVAEAEAAIANTTGMARLALVQNLLIPRQQAAAKAATAANTAQAALTATTTGAATATTLLSRTIAFLGGPIGAIITVLGIATTAWALFGSTAKKAGDEAREGVDEALKQAQRMKTIKAGGEFAPQIEAEEKALAALREERQRLLDQAKDFAQQPQVEFDIGAAIPAGDVDRLQAEIALREAKLNQLRKLNEEARKETEGAGKPSGISPELQAILDALKKAKGPDLSGKRLELVKAQAQAELDLVKQQLDESQKANDFALEQNLISVKAHAQERLAIVLQELEQERKAILLAIPAAEVLARSKDPEKAIEGQTKLVQLNNQLALLEGKRAAAANEATREQVKGANSLVDELNNVREQLDAILHNLSPADRRKAIAEQFRPILDQFKAAKNEAGQQAVLKLIDAKATEKELQDVERQISTVLDSLGESEKSLQLQIDAGLLTETERRRNVIELHKQAADEVKKLLPLYESLATKFDTPEAKLALQRFKNRIKELETVVDEVAKAIDDASKQSLGQAFSDVLNGFKSASQAAHEFGQSVIRSFLDIIGKRLGEKLFDSLFAKGSSLGSLGSSILGFFGIGATGKAEGGPITGPGTATSDSIPAVGPGGRLYRLSNGEFVVRAAAVRNWGLDFMERINNMSYRRAPRYAFATGGEVRDLTVPRGASSVQVVITPAMAHMTLREWFEGHIATELANR
jgi:hypothetical protein